MQISSDVLNIYIPSDIVAYFFGPPCMLWYLIEHRQLVVNKLLPQYQCIVVLSWQTVFIVLHVAETLYGFFSVLLTL